MRLLIAATLLALVAGTPASAHERPGCTRAPGDYEGGPNAWMMWTNPYTGSQAGYTYVDAGLVCAANPYRRRHIRHREMFARRHVHRVYARAGWVDTPYENRGGLCPKGDCDLLKTGARKDPA
jgi:hypothetical protein